MAMKAVCVLRGAGDTSGTVYFEQEVRCPCLTFTDVCFDKPRASFCASVLKWLAKLT